MKTRESLTPAQEARVLAFHERHPQASYQRIADATKVTFHLVKRLLHRPRNQPTKAEQVRGYAAEHPRYSPEVIAKQLGLPVPTVLRALRDDLASEDLRDENRSKPRSLEPLCCHDRARNLREHRDQVVYSCCLQEGPTKYLAIAMKVHETKVIGICPPLSLVIHAGNFDELELKLRAGVDALLDIAIHHGTFVGMPTPLESPRPAEIWAIGIKPQVGRKIYERWRQEPPVPELVLLQA